MTFPASHLAPPEPERNKEAASLIRQVGDDLNFRLRQLHEQLLEQVPDVDSIACALYEPSDDMLKTFVHSTRQGVAIMGYEFRLSESASLSD